MCQLNFRKKIHFNKTKNPFFDILKSTYQKHSSLAFQKCTNKKFENTPFLNWKKAWIFGLKWYSFPRFHGLLKLIRNILPEPPEQPCKQGKHLVSLIIPPQKWPQDNTIVQAVLEWSMHSLSEHKLSITGCSGLLWRKQNRQVLKLLPEATPDVEVVDAVPWVGIVPGLDWPRPRSRNSTMALSVNESAKRKKSKILLVWFHEFL